MPLDHLDGGPALPDPIEIEGDVVDDTTSNRAGDGPVIPIDPVFQPVPFVPSWKYLPEGGYFLQWRPKGNAFQRYNGTMRIERHNQGVTASGDLYRYNAFKFVLPAGLMPNPDPSPSLGLHCYPRKSYDSYLRVTRILEWFTTGSSFLLEFERFTYNHTDHSWTSAGRYKAKMVFKKAPSGYQAGATYLEGDLLDSSGNDVGRIIMGWVSKFLRKATLEIDRVSASEFPAENGAGLGWVQVFRAVCWDLTLIESDANVAEPSGISWSNAEMHAAMLARRDSADLDSVWRYHLLCVRRLDATSRGIMFDAGGTDSNNVPREGAAIASHWMIPNGDPWGTVAGQRFGTAEAPYFRTAVHEIGHAAGLFHQSADNGFMNTTGTIASSPGVFPSNIMWAFSPDDAKRLKHFPDPWVRPGMVPFGNSGYGSVPISTDDETVDVAGMFDLRVEPLHNAVPIGAPVRCRITLTNKSGTTMDVPASLSLKSEHVTGGVSDTSGNQRSFRSILRCIEDHSHATLEDGASISHDLTLLRGADGPLFAGIGMHDIEICVKWDVAGMPVSIRNTSSVMITPPVDDAHAEAAAKALSTPDLLLVLALGGDHLADAIAVLDTALSNPVLAPHWQAIQCKRLGQRFADRPADPAQALACIADDTVMSSSEAKRVAEVMHQVKRKDRTSGAAKQALNKLQYLAADDGELKTVIDKLTD